MDKITILKTAKSKRDACRQLGMVPGGPNVKKINEWMLELGIQNDNFDKPQIKYERYVKVCPICGELFETLKNHKKEKQTCSYACSNTFFRSGKNNGNWKEDAYRSTCFLYHKKECVICKEKNIVEVHHQDENHENNNPENLIPLCPTHHQYYHSCYRILILDEINEYIKNWKINAQTRELL
jgi:hypothetical protein